MAYTIASLDELGEGYGFRKIRKALGVTAFGVNALVFPPSYEGPGSLPRRTRTSSTSSTAGTRDASRSTATSTSSAKEGSCTSSPTTPPQGLESHGDEDLVRPHRRRARTATSSATASFVSDRRTCAKRRGALA